MSEEDSRTKQDLIFEVSKLNSQLSDEIIKIEKLQQENKELKERIDKAIKELDYMFQNEPANSSEYDYHIIKLKKVLEGDK